MAEGLPPGVEKLGGAPLAEYKGRGSLSLVLVGLAVFWGLVGLGLLVGGLLASRSDKSLLCLVPPGVLLVGVAAWAVNEWRRKHNLRALVFADGLVHVQGGRVNVFRWDEITEVYQSMQKTTRYGRSVQTIYTIKDAKGKKSVLTGELVGIRALGETIQREVTARLLPRYWQDYEAGSTLQFGKLGVSKGGLSKGKEVLPWDQIGRVKFDWGSISVKRGEAWIPWASITASSTPNLFVFLSMLDKIVGVDQ